MLTVFHFRRKWTGLYHQVSVVVWGLHSPGMLCSIDCWYFRSVFPSNHQVCPWLSKVGPTGCPETSVTIYQWMLRNMGEDQMDDANFTYNQWRLKYPSTDLWWLANDKIWHQVHKPTLHSILWLLLLCWGEGDLLNLAEPLRQWRFSSSVMSHLNATVPCIYSNI